MDNQTIKKSRTDKQCVVTGTDAHYQALVASAAAAILVIDESGVIIDANPYTRTLLGYDHRQLVGKNVECLMPPEHEGKHQHYLMQYLTGGEAKVIGTGRRVKARHVDGHLVPVHLAVSEVQIDSRREFIGIMSDLSALTQAQASVKHERNQLKTIINAIANPVFVRELGGRYTMANHACVQAVGVDNVEALADAFAQLLPKGGRETLNALDHQLTMNGEPVHTDVTLNDGRTFKLAKTLIHHLEGEPYAIVTVAYDATPLLNAMKDAERANQAKSDFLSAMSHELRTPLNCVLGYAQLLMNATSPALEATQQQYVAQIHQSGRHLLALINDVLDLAKIEAGKISLNPSWAPLRPMICEAIDSLLPLAHRQTVSLRHTLPDTLNGDIYVDATRFKQVLINLISNAIKYNHAGGRVAVSTRQQAETITIAVTDTGIGIEQDKLSALFEPFNRLAAEQTHIEGAGVGLAVTQQLIAQMQGEITVSSEVGKGSCFAVTFPYRGQSLTEIASSSTPFTLTQPHRVLFIEPDVAQQRLMADWFEDWPLLTLTCVHDLSLAAAMAHTTPPSLFMVSHAVLDDTADQVQSRLGERPMIVVNVPDTESMQSHSDSIVTLASPVSGAALGRAMQTLLEDRA
ncbi:PAS domain-containing sensor histidine kinase [Salinivibrio sp. YCSC6]|uniref:PAS domain-containing sensor histidine kinase n=1 Tax=Salinivibrio sp. YCSC6 TaxID=2003370 RepID=UPI000BBBDA7F|nr:PAS domain S-box protein [Salinivibrio sp. YCSC6]PCE65278.1 hypothetical protein B6G00_14940 [Salinivibrio sp. YCSC6]QCF37682.1 PAS domain S-box protein [Salinivibrio sp. YCSC6]